MTLVPFTRVSMGGGISPLVVAVPHAGRCYPPALLAEATVPKTILEQLEDRHADLLIEHAIARGAVAIVGQIARAWIDLNRAPDDVDPASRRMPGPPSTRALSGLGLVPRKLGGHALRAAPPTPDEVEQRIAMVHAPYHAAIASALDQALLHHGHAILIDCHSMPPLRGTHPARIIIGDRHGRSAGANHGKRMLTMLRNCGISAAMNAPYAGAYTLDRHGRPNQNIQAIQLEFDRTLYLDRALNAPGRGLAAAQKLFGMLAETALETERDRRTIAAE